MTEPGNTPGSFFRSNGHIATAMRPCYGPSQRTFRFFPRPKDSAGTSHDVEDVRRTL
jgi:hypothetical protein